MDDHVRRNEVRFLLLRIVRYLTKRQNRMENKVVQRETLECIEKAAESLHRLPLTEDVAKQL